MENLAMTNGQNKMTGIRYRHNLIYISPESLHAEFDMYGFKRKIKYPFKMSAEAGIQDLNDGQTNMASLVSCVKL
jgi:hypothetical protein